MYFISRSLCRIRAYKYIQSSVMTVYLCVLFCFVLFFQPKVVTDTDETELARQLERLERENAEVDGDDDAEEMEAKTED